MAGPRGPRKTTLKPGAKPKKAARARAEIKAVVALKEIPEIESLPPVSAEIVVVSAPEPKAGGPGSGALPRSKKAPSPHVKAALERALATSEGKEPPKVSTKGVDPALLADRARKEAEEASKAAGSEPPTAEPAATPGPGGALIYDVPRASAGDAYEDSYPETARLLCANGATDHDLADFFGVTLRSIQRWKLQRVAFRAAIFVGSQEYRDGQDANVERGLYQRATGYVQRVEKIMSFQGQIMRVQMEENVPADVAAARLWLANRKPDQWRVDPDKGNNGSAAEALGNMAMMEIARRMGMVLLAGMKAEEAVTVEAERVDEAG